MGNEQQQGQRPNQPSERTAKGIVARGRSVDVPDPSAQRMVTGYNTEGKAVTRAAFRSYGPGQEVTLPESEILSLRERGFLTDPDVTVPPLAEGPHFTETGHRATAA